MERLINWLESLFEDNPSEPVDLQWQGGIRILLFALAAVVACALGIAIYRYRRPRPGPQQEATPVPSVPDLEDDQVTADRLPADEWMDMARDLIARGDLRLGLRAMFLACLARLAQLELVVLEQHKSNREYLRELHRIAHDQPMAVEAFQGNIMMIERIWYGDHDATAETADAFQENQEQIFKL